MTKLIDENVLIKNQVESTVQERENIKLEYQKLFDSIKATRVQHQQEVNDLVKNYNQKTHAYADVRAKIQDLLIVIYELKEKLAKQAKNVNTKFDKSTTLDKLVSMTPLNKSKDLRYNQISQNQSLHVLQLKAKKFLLNTNSKSTSKVVKKSQSSFISVANKRYTLNSNACDSQTNVLKAKTINVVLDGSNLVCVSCGKDVFLMSHDKCVARYALSPNSRIKRALFTSIVAAKSSKLGAILVVMKYRLIIATPPKSTNKNLEGEDLLTGSRDSNLHTISISEMAASSPVYLMSKATSTKS
ncbi:hypothetical protein Tco_1429048 [Tanacetum coccineum]